MAFGLPILTHLIDSYEANLSAILPVNTDNTDLDNEKEVDEMEDGSIELKQNKKNFAPNTGPQALILTPTRELAIQIKDHLQTCCKYQNTKVCDC